MGGAADDVRDGDGGAGWDAEAPGGGGAGGGFLGGGGGGEAGAGAVVARRGACRALGGALGGELGRGAEAGVDGVRFLEAGEVVVVAVCAVRLAPGGALGVARVV